MIKRFIKFFKDVLRSKERKQYNYQLSKGTMVKYNNKRRSVKLRVHISELAKSFNELNYKGYSQNRIDIIEEYEYLGLEGVAKMADREMDLYLDKLKEKR